MRKAKHGKSVYLDVTIWYAEDTGKIHIVVPAVQGVHTTVNDNPESKRGHPNLFMKLARCLRKAGAPAPPNRH